MKACAAQAVALPWLAIAEEEIDRYRERWGEIKIYTKAIYIYMPLDDFWAHIFGILGLKLLVLWVSAWRFGLEPPGLVPGG